MREKPRIWEIEGKQSTHGKGKWKKKRRKRKKKKDKEKSTRLSRPKLIR